MRTAIVKGGTVVDVVMWDGQSSWAPPAGSQAVACGDNVGPGFTYAGGAFTAPAAVANVPQQVSALQARVALSRAGLLTAVEAFMASTAATAETKIFWQYADPIDRNHVLVKAIGAQLGLTDAQIDALFVAADQIS